MQFETSGERPGAGAVRLLDHLDELFPMGADRIDAGRLERRLAVGPTLLAALAAVAFLLQAVVNDDPRWVLGTGGVAGSRNRWGLCCSSSPGEPALAASSSGR